NGTGELRRPVERGEGGRFRLQVPVNATNSGGDTLPLRIGVWELRLRELDEPSTECDVLTAPPLWPELPLEISLAGKDIKLERRWNDTLIVDSSSVLSAAERSAFAQEQQRSKAYPAARRQPLREAVLYDVFTGRGYSDSPRAIHAELVRRGTELEHI